MLNENAKKWVEALRSGKYQQGKNALLMDGKYCCLGVACEVAIENGMTLRTSRVDDRVEFGGKLSFLPQEVQVWLGLSSSDGEFLGNTLIRENDERCKTFPEIAALIESEPQGLFRQL